MKQFFLKTFLPFLGIFILAFATTACDSDPVVPQDEIIHKHHEDPVKAVLTLTKGKLAEGSQFSSLRLSQFIPSEEMQTIAWAISAEKGWELVEGSATDWEVVSLTEHPEVVYQLTIKYYDDHGELMNHQFINEGQDKIHQHFFSWFDDGVRVRNVDRLPYEYVYADEDEKGNSIAATNPLGFQGFIRFRDTQLKFNLSIDLMHATQSKYDAQGKPSPFYSPSAGQIGTALWDISLKIPIRIQQKPDLTMFPNIARAEIVFIEGHLHGERSFHENTYPVQMKYMGRRDTLRFTFENDTWSPDSRNPQYLPLQSGYPCYAMVIKYFDQANELINVDFLANHSEQYQHFFTVSDIAPSEDGIKEGTDNNSPDFFKYIYCDTDPWDRTNKFGNARFIGDQNPIGFKGYFQFHKTRKTFVLNLHLMKTHSSKLTGKDSSGNSIPSPWYLPTNDQKEKENWFPTLKIPVFIYMSNEERDIDDIELDSKETDFNVDNLKSIHSMMKAYGISFQEAVAELYWNIYGERPPHSNAGFWF